MGQTRGWEPFSAGFGIVLAIMSLVVTGLASDLHAPPRFDGAGYSVLADALATGRGYRGIDHPDAPRHTHFPPGYPAALALLWKAAGRSVVSAHLLSMACTAGAVVAAWLWFRTMYRPRVAALLALALAWNWTWVRAGGSIQSEPVYVFVVQLTLLATVKLARRAAAGPVLGILLACATLTRHVGGAVVAAVLTELWLRGRARAAAVAGLTCLAMLAPWVVWLDSTQGTTQADLLPGRGGLPALIVSQAVFYTRRIPDALTGPTVEIATVFRPTGSVSLLANLWAVGATGLILIGLAKTLKTPRRRLAGLSAGTTGTLLLAWPFTEAGRFLIPLVPCLLVGATEGLGLVLSRLRRVRRPRGVAAALILAATLPYSVYALATDRAGAQRRTHAGFDAACRWIAREGSGRPGPVLTRYPGEVYWQTGRTALGPPADGPDAVARVIRRYGVAYLIVDEAPFVDALPSPLLTFLKAEPGAARIVWKADAGRPPVAVYAVDQGFAGPSNVRVP